MQIDVNRAYRKLEAKSTPKSFGSPLGLAQDSLEAVVGIDLAGVAPGDELGHIYPAVGLQQFFA